MAYLLNKTDIDRFWAKVECGQPDECWPWTGTPDNGYGRFWAGGKSLLAHRVAWILKHGDVPPGKQLDHLCRNRACCNPAHLEPVTIAVNVLRGNGVTATNASKAHCLRGHALDAENTYITPSGTRNCKTCQRARLIAWQARQKASA